MQNKPEIKQDPMYLLLRHGKTEEFNTRRARGETVDLTSCDFRGLDLRGLDASGLDFTNSYFRQTDLRGIDFSSCKLEGASIYGAKISGAYFPRELSAAELTLSLMHGTRLRYTNS